MFFSLHNPEVRTTLAVNFFDMAADEAHLEDPDLDLIRTASRIALEALTNTESVRIPDQFKSDLIMRGIVEPSQHWPAMAGSVPN
ncbi:hypothetical protein [Primorskyibacter sp. S87]|uniref:hypothetical protein n=1 Tax=Primorskyibacter sp. S87 TaxID=3415126 RepID=UPI003C7EB010